MRDKKYFDRPNYGFHFNFHLQSVHLSKPTPLNYFQQMVEAKRRFYSSLRPRSIQKRWGGEGGISNQILWYRHYIENRLAVLSYRAHCQVVLTFAFLDNMACVSSLYRFSRWTIDKNNYRVFVDIPN